MLDSRSTYLATLSLSSSAFDFLSCSFLVSGAVPPLPSPFSRLDALAYMIAHSCATLSYSFGFRINIPATSASCGSFGSGVLRRDWRDSRADLMVRTGDHAADKVSRQMAPYQISQPHRPCRWIGRALTVWLLTFGCHILVSKRIMGGLKG